jgi:hypothetical protein
VADSEPEGSREEGGRETERRGEGTKRGNRFPNLLEGIIRKERDEYFDEENGEEITGEELSSIV